MKTSWSSVLLTAAVLAVGTATVNAQTRVTAEIPFAFQTLDGMHPAGHYQITRAAQGLEAIRLTNLDTQTTTMSVGVLGGASGDQRPRLVFHCGDSGACRLAGMWTGDGQAWTFAANRKKAAEAERVAVVYLHRGQGD